MTFLLSLNIGGSEQNASEPGNREAQAEMGQLRQQRLHSLTGNRVDPDSNLALALPAGVT